MHVNAGAVRERHGKDSKRAGFASEAHRATGQLMPGLVIPQVRCEGLWRNGARGPKPSNLVAATVFPSGESPQRSRERRQGFPVRRGEALGEAVQEKVDLPRRSRLGGRSASG